MSTEKWRTVIYSLDKNGGLETSLARDFLMLSSNKRLR